MIPTLDLLF